MSAHGNARIDVTDAASLLWSLRLHMTAHRLVEVVARVSTMANAVECYVGSRGYKPRVDPARRREVEACEEPWNLEAGVGIEPA